MAEPVIIREGASLRTADELGVLFVEDAVSLGAELSPWGRTTLDRLNALLSEWRDPQSGTAWLPESDDREDLYALQSQMETELYTLGYVVEHEDGYVITLNDDDDDTED